MIFEENLSFLENYSLVFSSITFLCFIIIYLNKIINNKWTIRVSSQYFIILSSVLLSFVISIFLDAVLSIIISFFFVLLLLLNEKDILNEYSDLEKRGITSVLKKYQNEDELHFCTLSKSEQEKWKKENCNNPIKITIYKAIIIVYIPVAIGITIKYFLN